MNQLIHIGFCAPNELQEIVNCQSCVIDGLDHPEFYCPSEPCELAPLLCNNLHFGFIIGAYLANRIIGFASVKRCSGEYYGYHHELSQDYYSIEDTIVLERYRGRGLQRKLWQYIIALLPKGAVLLCTIHPENFFSLRNAINLGFVPQMLVTPSEMTQRLVLKWDERINTPQQCLRKNLDT